MKSWILDKQSRQTANRQDERRQGTERRPTTQAEHDQKTQSSAGQTEKNGAEGAEQKTGQKNLAQHQKDTGPPVHQIDRIEQYRVGQPKFNSRNSTAQKGTDGDGLIKIAKNKRFLQ